MRLAERLALLWDHLCLGAGHVATQMPGDVAEFATTHSHRIASATFCVPTRLDPDAFTTLAPRTLLISGDQGLTEEVTARAAARLPGSQRLVLAEYNASGWADVMAERGAEILPRLHAFLAGLPRAADAPRIHHVTGNHAGITYRIQGNGPALVLLPFFLAPSQWDPALEELARNFTTIVLGGPHIGGVAALEDRAQAPSYRGMLRSLFDLIAPTPGEAILDIGCGSGALDRLLARRYAANPITATDVNPFLLREATALAEADGLAERVTFREANAETLPFSDASFDCAYSVTVLEECDADKALAEIFRVLGPGGRAGIIVRATDIPQWWHLDLPEAIQRKVTVPPQSVGARGVADASLYRRMAAVGFRGLISFPSLVTLDNPDGPIWRYREDHAVSLLTEEEIVTWRATTGQARAKGMLFQAHAMHCVVGRKT